MNSTLYSIKLHNHTMWIRSINNFKVQRIDCTEILCDSEVLQRIAHISEGAVEVATRAKNYRVIRHKKILSCKFAVFAYGLQ